MPLSRATRRDRADAAARRAAAGDPATQAREEPAPPIAEILALQAAAGNAAVARALKAGTAMLARTRFKDVGAASTWLTSAPAREEEEEDDEYATRILLASDYGVERDFAANYGLVIKALGVASAPQLPAPAAANVPKKRTVPPAIWEHIVNGTYVAKDDKVTGLHTMHGDSPKARGYGDKAYFGNKGCYKRAVERFDASAEKRTGEDEDEKPRSKAPAKPAKQEARKKKHESSFYPDDWTLQDIRDAIEYATARDGNRLDVLWPAKGVGIQLWFNGESYFPYTSD